MNNNKKVYLSIKILDSQYPWIGVENGSSNLD